MLCRLTFNLKPGKEPGIVKRLIVIVIGLSLWLPQMARSDHKNITLFASQVLVETGLMGFLLPRFSLKTGVSVHLEPLAQGALPPTDGVALQQARGSGRLALRGAGRDFAVRLIGPQTPQALRFADWLLSDIGQRTIAQFAPDGEPPFSGAANSEPTVRAALLPGNVTRGEVLSYANCGRCHVIGAQNRMKGIGSTPSFALLRSFDNWQERFSTFYVLNPHPSFSQVTGVTAPFDETLPPPISPLRLTQDELDDITAFAASIKPADLGGPLVHQ